MSLGTILIIALVILLVTTLPTWRYSLDWGYVPSGALSVAVFVIAVMLIVGKI